ncbi:MAG: EF-hand domain-containing protein [Planctomycetota bacterium]
MKKVIVMIMAIAIINWSVIPTFASDNNPNQGRQQPGKGDEARRAEMLKKYDKDGDGKLSESEFGQMRKDEEAARWAEIIKKYDKDGDGKLSESEFEQMRKDEEDTRQAEMLKKYDKNRDGKLSESEREQMRTDNQNKNNGPISDTKRTGLQKGDEAHRAEMLKKYDKDGDGKLSESEREQMRTDEAAARWAEILKKYDKDGDSKLSESEFEQMRKDEEATCQAEMLKKYDKDGDGKLSESEREQAMKDQPKKRPDNNGVRDRGQGEGRGFGPK